MKKHQTNTELITEMMNFSNHGAMIQVFVIEAIRSYAEQTLAAPPWSKDDGIVSQEAWKGCAQEALTKLKNRGK